MDSKDFLRTGAIILVSALKCCRFLCTTFFTPIIAIFAVIFLFHLAAAIYDLINFTRIRWYVLLIFLCITFAIRYTDSIIYELEVYINETKKAPKI